MKNKNLALLMAGCFAMSTLTGCSLFEKPPTAEELVAGVSTTLDSEKGDMSIKLVMDMSADMGEMMEGATMEMGIELDADMQYDEDTMYMEGDVGIDVLGMSIEQEMKTYQQKDGDEKTEYSYDAETDTWTFTVSEIEDEDKEKEELDVSIFEELTLKEIEKEDTEYVVTATIAFDKMSEIVDMDTEDLTGEMTSGVDMQDMKMDLTMTFDRETRNVKTIKMEVDPDSISEIEGAKINEFTIELEINTPAEDLEVEVPESVIRDAIEEKSADFEYEIEEPTVETPEVEVPAITEEPTAEELVLEDPMKEEPVVVTSESTGKYSIDTFKALLDSHIEDATFYDYQSDYGYVSTETEIYGDNWVVDIELSQFDTEDLAKEEWEWSYAGDYEKEYLEEYHAKDGATVDGYSNDNTMYWVVNGDRYDTRYAFLDGNTIVYITGYVFDWDHAPTAAEGEEMAETFEAVLEILEYRR